MWLCAISFLKCSSFADSCSSGRDCRYRFLQTPPHGDALAVRSHFTSIRLCGGLAPPGCRTYSAHSQSAADGGAVHNPFIRNELALPDSLTDHSETGVGPALDRLP